MWRAVRTVAVPFVQTTGSLRNFEPRFAPRTSAAYDPTVPAAPGAPSTNVTPRRTTGPAARSTRLHDKMPLHLSQRRLQPELMDRPGLGANEHHRALRGLGRLNAASGVCRQLWGCLSAVAAREVGRPLRVLDIASGGGDVAWGLWNLARRYGIDLEILGMDVSAAACEYARARCQAAKRAIAFQQADVTRQSLPAGFDVATCSLFLHHLTFGDAADLLRRMAAAARTVVVSDLRRSTAGYVLAHAACRTLTRSPVVRYDGPQSVANAFSFQEMQSLCAAAGLSDAVVRTAWPCRLTIVRHGG